MPQDRPVANCVARMPRSWAAPRTREGSTILGSGLFDVGWYVAHNPEIEEAASHPVDHYLREGAALGLSPHPDWDFDQYQSEERMVAQGVNPVLHYLER